MSPHSPFPSPEHPILAGIVAALNPPDMSPLPVGTRIGGDVVEGVLGRGGFATVYRVRSPSGYVSALKVMPLDQGPERAERAWREMLLGTRLHHPNLVRQLGSGQWPLENPRYLWVKFELVDGPTLDEWGLASGRTVGGVLDRVLEVARALAVSHEAGVLHRDVKEANILVRQSDGQAVLVDFGVGYHPAYPTLTKGMFPPGTPAYRAPEAWAYGRAHAGEPGAHYRAGVGDDLYAVGVVLYRLLTGRFPFRPAEHGGEDVEAVLHREPLPPHLVNPRVPLAVEAVCLRLLAKTPEARSTRGRWRCARCWRSCGPGRTWTGRQCCTRSGGARRSRGRAGAGCWRWWAWGWPWRWGPGGSPLARKWRPGGPRRNLGGPWSRLLPRRPLPRPPPRRWRSERTVPP